MRRSVFLYLFGGLFFLVMTAVVAYAYGTDTPRRHHQHLERPSEAQLGPCHVCGKSLFCTHLPIIKIDAGGRAIPGRPILFNVQGLGQDFLYEFISGILAEFDRGMLATILGELLYEFERGELDEDELFELIDTLVDDLGSEFDYEESADYIRLRNELFQTSEDGETEIVVSVSVIDNFNAWNHKDDAPAHVSEALFRIRGNSSRWFDKASYRIRLRHDNDPERENPLPLLGMPDGTEWALHGPFLDKTLMRNYAWMNITAEIMGFAPNVRFCEVFVDGEYMGVYVLMETVRVQPGRVDITRYTEGDLLVSYLVQMDSPNPARRLHTFGAYTRRYEPHRFFDLLYPGLTRQSEHVVNFVTMDISNIEKKLYSLELFHNPGAYRHSINIDSFVDYYLLKEFLVENDTFSNSTYFYRDARGRLTIGPIWDLNNVLNNFFREFPYDEFILSDRGWYDRMFIDAEFNDQVIRRWRQLRRGILSEEKLLNYHTGIELWLGSAIDRNYEVWGYSFDPANLTSRTRRNPRFARSARSEEMEETGLTLYDVNPSSYAEAMSWMLEFMVNRGRWMDRHIESLRQYAHPSRHALWALD